tara:strand:+ start:402 stop:602 length:201 start_codon:yes stop_codon:yes gene_type:complete
MPMGNVTTIKSTKVFFSHKGFIHPTKAMTIPNAKETTHPVNNPDFQNMTENTMENSGAHNRPKEAN